MSAKLDKSKLTSQRVKGIISTTLELLEKHKHMHELMWELLAGVCCEAPIPSDATFVRFGIHAVAIKTPRYWLVYQPAAKHQVETMVKGEFSPDANLPRPIGVLILSGNTRSKRTRENPDGMPTPLYYALAGSKLIGEFEPTRGVIEITNFYNVR